MMRVAIGKGQMVMRTSRVILSLIVALLMTGCSFKLFSPQEYKTYVLSAVETGKDLESKSETGSGEHTGEHGTTVLIVTDTVSPSYLAGQKLLFREGARELLAYQYSAWAEAPPRQITRALERRLASRNKFKAVVRPSTGVRADIQLNTALLDFFHDAQKRPGVGVMSVEAELVSLNNGAVIAKQTFVKRVPVEEFEAAGAVVALDAATTAIISEITTWVEQAS